MTTFDWSQVFTLFGGSFDPPHFGHREAVLGLLRDPGVQHVCVLPSGQTPLKINTAAPRTRLEMTKLMFQNLGSGRISVSDYEIERNSRTSLPSYTYHTILHFRELLKGAPLAFVIGSDQLEQLPNWYEGRKLLQLCHWIVLKRRPESLDSIERKLRILQDLELLSQHPIDESEYQLSHSDFRLRLVTTDAPEVSSSDIRDDAAHERFDEAVLGPVLLRYIREHSLYQIKERKT